MQRNNAMIKLMETYTGATLIPAMYIDGSSQAPIMMAKDLDFSAISEYGDFEEISNFINFMSKLPSKSEGIFYTVFTKSHLVYNIIQIKHSKSKEGVLISGPIIPFFPNESLLDEIIYHKKLPAHKKNEFKHFMRLLPLVSHSRVNQLGQLLYLLSKSYERNNHKSCQVLYGEEKPTSDLLIKNLITDAADDNYFNEYYALYKLNVDLGNKITHGNISGIKDTLNKHACLYWEMKPASENLRTIKNKCIIICSMASGHAIQGNAQYDRIIDILTGFTEKLEQIHTADDIVYQTALTIERFAYQVSTANNEYSRHINRVLQYLRHHISENITLQALAAYTGLNPVYLSSLIKKETNLSLSDHINKIRIEEAKNMLIFTNKSIQDIAYYLGYSYQSHFSAVFRKYEGITPIEFRIKHAVNYH